MHPSDEILLALSHGELASDQSVAISKHVVACGACTRTLDEMRRDYAEVGSLLSSLDRAAPPARVTFRPPRVSTRSIRRRQLIAASMAIFAVSAVAAAIPGGPLRQWLQEWRGFAARPAVTASPVLPSVPRTSGIALSPSGNAEIMFSHEQTMGELVVLVSDTGGMTVKAMNGDVGYAVGRDRLVIDNRVPALRYEITVPSTQRRVVIRMASRRILDIRYGQAIATGGAPGSTGTCRPRAWCASA